MAQFVLALRAARLSQMAHQLVTNRPAHRELRATQAWHMGVSSDRFASRPRAAEHQLTVRAPESIEHPALTIDEASGLMAHLGFVAFRTPPRAAVTDSCLMAMVRDAPTRRHFDPKSVGFWVVANGHGALRVADRDSRTPISQPYSWGRISLTDRFGARNSFASFGGWLTGERVATDALLLIFRSPAAILRLPGHSQHRDLLSDRALAFFGRIVPRLWSHPGNEQLVSSAPPEGLYGAFLLYEARRFVGSTAPRDVIGEDARALARELARMQRSRPDALVEGRELLALLELWPAALNRQGPAESSVLARRS